MKFIFKSLLLFIPLLSNAQGSTIKEIDVWVNEFFESTLGWFPKLVFSSIPLNDSISIPWVLVLMVVGAVVFTFAFKFVNIRHFFTSIRIVSGKYDGVEGNLGEPVSESVHSIDGDNPDTIKVEGHNGEVTHFQALTAALSATVGIGNIAGVAIALSLGGPGATFWMIIAGFIGMSSKFVECTLGVKYRHIDKNGVVYGGPMYYLKDGLGGVLGKVLAVFFAMMCVFGSFGGGNMFQANQAFSMLEFITGGEESFLHGNGIVFGLVFAVLVGIVIIGGIKSIVKVTDKLVPFMVLIYLVAGFAVLFVNYSAIPSAILQIWEGAFRPMGVAGGFVGVLIIGFKRAAFSNEAGIGSAAIAHSAVKTEYPASEGLVALLEPFIDTVIICTMTALVLIVSGKLELSPGGMDGARGVVMTSEALSTGFSWSPWLLAVAVVLFAFSTIVSWSYYGLQSWTFLFGRGKFSENTFKIIFCVFVVIGATVSMGSVIDFSDAAIFAMLVPNMIGLFILMPKVKDELKRYIKEKINI